MLTVGFAIAGLALFLSWMLGPTSAVIIYFAPAFIFAGMAIALRKRPASSALIAIGLAYGVAFSIAIGASIVAGIPDDTKRASCESFCLDRTGNFIFRMFVAGAIGTVVAIPAAILAAIFATPKATTTQ